MVEQRTISISKSISMSHDAFNMVETIGDEEGVRMFSNVVDLLIKRGYAYTRVLDAERERKRKQEIPVMDKDYEEVSFTEDADRQIEESMEADYEASKDPFDREISVRVI